VVVGERVWCVNNWGSAATTISAVADDGVESTVASGVSSVLDSLISSIGKVDLIASSDDGWFSILIVTEDGGDLVQFCGWFSGVNTIAKSVVQRKGLIDRGWGISCRGSTWSSHGSGDGD